MSRFAIDFDHRPNGVEPLKTEPELNPIEP